MAKRWPAAQSSDPNIPIDAAARLQAIANVRATEDIYDAVDDRIKCGICNVMVENLSDHLLRYHPDVPIGEYAKSYGVSVDKDPIEKLPTVDEDEEHPAGPEGLIIEAGLLRDDDKKFYRNCCESLV